MRISDWSSDVCSSDLQAPCCQRPRLLLGRRDLNRLAGLGPVGEEAFDALFGQDMLEQSLDDRRRRGHQVGADLRGFEDMDAVAHAGDENPGVDRKSTVCTPVTNATIVCSLLLEKNNK